MSVLVGIVATHSYTPPLRRPAGTRCGPAPEGAPQDLAVVLAEELLSSVPGPTRTAVRSSLPAFRNMEEVGDAAVEPERTLSDMMVATLRDALEKVGASGFDGAIVSHSSVGDSVDALPARRIDVEFGGRGGSFAMTRCDGASLATSLLLVQSLMEVDEDRKRMAVVCGESWRYPFSRLASNGAVLGDGAAAAILERAPCRGWLLRVVEHTVLHPAEHVADWIGAILSDSGFMPAQLRLAVSSGFAPAAQNMIVERLGIAGVVDHRPEGTGFLCSADALLRFDQHPRMATAAPGDLALLWEMDSGGGVGCICLEYRDETGQSGELPI